MPQISEWLPNPIGKDTGEWIEIYNPGPVAVNLSGWKIQTQNGREYSLFGNMAVQEYKVFQRSVLKFQLRNTDEVLRLFDPQGKLVDESLFQGTAPEGKSVIHEGETSFFGSPTPGTVNAKLSMELIEENHPMGVVLNSMPSNWNFWGGMIGAVITLPLLIIIAIKQDHDLSELFFGKN